jgi:Ca2+-binding EF-hand superfamily protein
MAYFGVDKDIRIQEINLTFKNIIRNRQGGQIGLRSLAIIFKKFDRSGNGKLDESEFEAALGAFG